MPPPLQLSNHEGNAVNRTLHLNIVAYGDLEEVLTGIALHLNILAIGLEGHLHYDMMAERDAHRQRIWQGCTCE